MVPAPLTGVELAIRLETQEETPGDRRSAGPYGSQSVYLASDLGSNRYLAVPHELRSTRSPIWDLRIACAVLSLNLVEPFLRDLGFRPTEGKLVRRISRELIRPWLVRNNSSVSPEDLILKQAPGAWLRDLSLRYGRSLARRFGALSNSLAETSRYGSERLAWTELVMTSHSLASISSVDPSVLETFSRLSRNYLRTEARLDDRVKLLAIRPRSVWDKHLLSAPFFDREDLPENRFDPGPWVSALLRQRQWLRFRASLIANLSPSNLTALVSAARNLPSLRLSEHLSLPSIGGDALGAGS